MKMISEEVEDVNLLIQVGGISRQKEGEMPPVLWANDGFQAG